jgi:uncharacterized protein YyaL (SSP411 family)
METNPTAHPNRLIEQTSPYLLQHAHNPVDWHPWNQDALEKAQREDRPILLSIGYSACHWCHVMAHESFEDEDVARVMNELFVCIKVDREERPDLDKVYQTAHHLLVQRAGGWPLTMFLTPDDHTPFFGGTYFPKQAKYGMPAFVDILRKVADYYHAHRQEIRQQNDSVKEALQRIQPGPADPDAMIQPAVVTEARVQLQQQFDPVHGGFGSAPKFPHPTNLEFCLRYWATSVLNKQPDEPALTIVRHTLRRMGDGGLYDQLGGGFCRYSVDERWMIPHFEKMLYDNGPLLALYTDAAVATGDGFYRRIALETADWVLREMQSPEGGYYSTIDADSEGHEGKFYVWTREQVQALLNEEEFRIVEARYGLDLPPNFEHQWWHLHVHQEVDAIAHKLGLSEQRVIVGLTSARQKMFSAREKRVHPGRDEKILTSWNGLMIKGMARAGRFFNRPDLIDSAERALDFIRSQLWTGERLLATAKDGKAHLNAYLDDYVFLIDGILELLQARWRNEDLDFAIALADVVLDHFQDHEMGAFYFTADDHEKLAYRPKPVQDEATPSGNGVAAQVLLRLGHLLGNTHYLDAAERTLKALYASVSQYPSAHNSLLLAIEEYLDPPQLIVLRGEEDQLRRWTERGRKYYAPRRLVFTIPSSAKNLPGALAGREAKTVATAYVCTGHTCSAPTTDFAQFEQELKPAETAAL